MAAALQQAVGVAATLVKGSGGIFDVTVDGQVVYCKRQTGRFPEPAEIIALLTEPR